MTFEEYDLFSEYSDVFPGYEVTQEFLQKVLTQTCREDLCHSIEMNDISEIFFEYVKSLSQDRIKIADLGAGDGQHIFSLLQQIFLKLGIGIMEKIEVKSVEMYPDSVQNFGKTGDTSKILKDIKTELHIPTAKMLKLVDVIEAVFPDVDLEENSFHLIINDGGAITYFQDILASLIKVQKIQKNGGMFWLRPEDENPFEFMIGKKSIEVKVRQILKYLGYEMCGKELWKLNSKKNASNLHKLRKEFVLDVEDIYISKKQDKNSLKILRNISKL